MITLKDHEIIERAEPTQNDIALARGVLMDRLFRKAHEYAQLHEPNTRQAKIKFEKPYDLVEFGEKRHTIIYGTIEIK